MGIAVTPIITVDEYLESELQAEVKHDYLGGTVYPRTCASEAHNVIAMNLYAALGMQLRGKRCRPFGSDSMPKACRHASGVLRRGATPENSRGFSTHGPPP